VSRLRTFLAWKDVRKNLKDDDEKGGAPEVPGDAVGDAVESAGVEEAGEGGVDGAVSKKAKRKGIALPWDLSSFFSITPPSIGNEDEDSEDNDDETIRRLRTNDERTRDLTREEYVHWAECRQASFTWRKAKRFKEWSRLADVHEGGRVGEDVLDLLGFLCAEIVQVLGVEARKVLSEEDARSNAHTRQTEASNKHNRRITNQGLFVMAKGSRNAIDACHVREATRRLQQMKGARSRAFAGLGLRTVDGGKRLILVGGFTLGCEASRGAGLTSV
jgi:transcription initiation protein SPT3